MKHMKKHQHEKNTKNQKILVGNEKTLKNTNNIKHMKKIKDIKNYQKSSKI